MIDVKNKKCEYNGCEKQPNYNFKGETKGKYCVKHKDLGMIDIKHILCEFNDCNIRPSFNFKNEKKYRFCNKHKLENNL
jgi:hypothetical protein